MKNNILKIVVIIVALSIALIELLLYNIRNK